MFARISGVYDFMNHLLSFNRDRPGAATWSPRLDTDAWEVLDLCAGTGDLALEAVRQEQGPGLDRRRFLPRDAAAAAGASGAPGAWSWPPPTPWPCPSATAASTR